LGKKRTYLLKHARFQNWPVTPPRDPYGPLVTVHSSKKRVVLFMFSGKDPAALLVLSNNNGKTVVLLVLLVPFLIRYVSYQETTKNGSLQLLLEQGKTVVLLVLLVL